MLNTTIKVLIYLAIFLLPIFVLPLTVLPLAWNKFILLIILGFLALILWMVDIIKTGVFRLNWTGLSTAILALLAVLGLSTVFSGARVHGFWSAESAGSYLHFIVYIIFFFLASHILRTHKDIIRASLFLLTSSLIVALLFLVQLFFGPTLVWEFAKTAGFNLIGSVWTMAVFLGGMTVVLVSWLGDPVIFKNKYLKITGCLALLLFLASLVVVDFTPVWLGLALGALLIIWQKIKAGMPAKQTSISESAGLKQAGANISLKPVYLPALIFILAVALAAIKLPLPEHFGLPNLINLSSQSTYSIMADTFSGSFKNTLLGSGPATFEYQYVLHQPLSIVHSIFWQTRFIQGGYALATWLIEFGILGLVGFALLIIFFLYQGLRKVILANPTISQTNFSTSSAFFASGVYFLLCWFLYSADFSLLFIVFLILGLWLACTNQSRKKEIIFTRSPQQAFLIMLLGIIIIAGSGIILFFAGKKYIGAVYYAQAIRSTSIQGFKVDTVIDQLAKAIKLDSAQDLYLRELTQVYLIKINQIQADQALTPEQQQQEMQAMINRLETVVQKIIEVNPDNSQNWQQAANIYANLAALNLPGAHQLAASGYTKAMELSPMDPSIRLNLASLDFKLAKNVQTQLAQPDISPENKDKLQAVYDQSIASALDYLEACLELKNNYAPAYYLRAMLYELTEQYDLALANYGAVLRLEPGNQEVAEKLKTLPALIEKNQPIQD